MGWRTEVGSGWPFSDVITMRASALDDAETLAHQCSHLIRLTCLNPGAMGRAELEEMARANLLSHLLSYKVHYRAQVPSHTRPSC